MAFKSKRAKAPEFKLNLIPILDSVFILIFFLLMSSRFVKLYEIGSDRPILNTQEPASKEAPWALKLKISSQDILITMGINETLVKKIEKNKDGQYDYGQIHAEMIKIKRENRQERSVILNAARNVPYGDLVKIIDEVRELKGGETIGQTQMEEKGSERVLFDQVVFSKY